MILDHLTVALKNKFDTEQRDGIHLSDMSLCMRKAVFRRIQPTPTTMKELNFYTSGRAIHDAIQTLANHDTSKFEIEKEIEYQNCVGHIDLYDTEENIPIECKSMRTSKVDKPKPHHVDQLKNYMAVTTADKGIILYQLLLHFDETPFVEFEIKMDKKERSAQLTIIEEKAALYADALAHKDAMIIPDILDDKDLNWLCKSCPYLKQCQDAKQ